MGHEEELKDWVKEARRRLWDAEFIRKNDEQRKGESDSHWKARRARNKERVERREEVVETLVKKLKHLKKKKKRRKKDDHPSQNAVGWAVYDGRDVPAWMVYWLDKSRDAGWKGVVVSGVRTAAYSIQLCENMCGAPSCPGRCAGASSNHNMPKTAGYPSGAIDVSDFYNFEDIQFKIGSPLRNDLPIDPVHFSVSGH